MKTILSLVFGAVFAVSGAFADEAEPADDTVMTPSPWEVISQPESDNLNDFLWLKRPVVIFADTENDPRFQQQIELLQARADELAERDVIVLTDTNPDAAGALRKKLRPRGFMLVLIGKDGGVKLRKPFPWDVRELTRSIDKMPMRQREIRERRQP